jgi:hypothetical protein
MATKITYYVCDNCPTLPKFNTIEALQSHWDSTHNVSMVISEQDPWGQRPPRTRALFHTEDVEVG